MREEAPQHRLGTALEVKIQAQRGSLSEKERSVADFLLRDPKAFVSLSISATATRCGVSETVIIRLYRKLGYAGFHAFKIDIAQSLTEGTARTFEEIQSGDDLETIKQKVFATARQALDDAVPAVDGAALGQVRDAIVKAERVVLAAFGGSAPVVFDLAHKLLKLGIIATVLTDSHLQVMAAAVMGKGDLLIAFSHSGQSRDLVEALQLARQGGALTVAITGIPASPAAAVAELALHTPCRETQHQTDSMNSRFVQLAVIDTLYIALTLVKKERGRAAIRQTSLAAARKKL